MSSCYKNPAHSYWTEKCLPVPYTCINRSINEVCLKCSPERNGNADKNNHSPEMRKFDPFDHSWFGRCKMDRPHTNPFTSHLNQSHACRHRGTVGSLTYPCTFCTPEFLKFLLLSPHGSATKCWHQPEIIDPFEKALLSDARNVDRMIPFLHKDLDNLVGHWYESSHDEYGNERNDDNARHMRDMLLQRPRMDDCMPYEVLNKEWLKKINEIYWEVAAEEI